MTEETLTFQAEVSRLLDIVARSLYSQKEVFLRELISNASDACDRLRYLAITDPSLTAGDEAFQIRLAVDSGARTLTVTDNGIGMTREELVENLGTIARSGTLKFLEQTGGDGGDAPSLIGQFGVGFYSAFMVAKEVEVITRRAGSDTVWSWRSDGKGSFTLADLPAGDDRAPTRGTRIVMHLNEGEDEFLDAQRLRHVVKTHSDHIAIPIVLAPVADGDAEETLNQASALWTRPKSEITEDQYKEFYRHSAHAFDEPWLTVHYRAEGVIEYAALVFVPSTRPMDLFHPDRKHHVKLFVRRVFVGDEVEGLVPSYLRFLRGVVDSQDLPLNVSREMLQSNPMVTKMRQGLTKRVLGELKKQAENDADGYALFWDAFGPVLKEGLYEDRDQEDALLELARFKHSGSDGLVSLEGYIEALRPGQDAIYYITGEDADSALKSPHLEGFRAKGIDVLLMTDPVDEFWVGSVGSYKEKPFKSVTRGAADLASVESPDTETEDKPAPASGIDALIARLKLALGSDVKDVRASERLTDSPVCLIADDGDMDIHLERLLRQHRQVNAAAPRVLEVNPTHPLVTRLSDLAARPGADGEGSALIDEMAHLLLDQARIVEGESVADPAAFSRRLSLALARGLPQ